MVGELESITSSHVGAASRSCGSRWFQHATLGARSRVLADPPPPYEYGTVAPPLRAAAMRRVDSEPAVAGPAAPASAALAAAPRRRAPQPAQGPRPAAAPGVHVIGGAVNSRTPGHENWRLSVAEDTGLLSMNDIWPKDWGCEYCHVLP